MNNAQKDNPARSMQAGCLLADGDHAIAIHGCVLAVYNLGENSLVSAIAANVSFSKARLSVILGTAMYEAGGAGYYLIESGSRQRSHAS